MINISLVSGRASGSGKYEITCHCLELTETLSFSLLGIDWDYFDDMKSSFPQLNYQFVNQKIGNDYNSILYRTVIDS